MSSIAAASSATMRGLRQRGVEFVRDDGVQNLEERRRIALDQSERERAIHAQRSGQERERRLREWMSTAVHHRPKRRTSQQIIERIARAYGVSVDEIKGQSRKVHITTARQAAMYWCRRLSDASYPEIARRFGKDHTTVIHACRSYPAKRAQVGRTLKRIASEAS